MTADVDNECEEPIGYVLGTGTWRDWLPAIPRPVLALGESDLFRVMVEGSGFTFRAKNGEFDVIGFVTTRFVAAISVREAEAKACASILREWERKGWREMCGVSPLLRVNEINPLSQRFRLRSGGGFAFFGADEAEGCEAGVQP